MQADESIHSLDDLTDEERRELERQREFEREQRRQRVLLAMSALAVLAILLFLASFSYEDSRLAADPGRPVWDIDPRERARAVDLPVEALYTLLPPTIRGFATKANHNVPHAHGIQAEALYDPDDMQLQLASPMTVYCLLTAWESEGRAAADIERIAEDFPLEAATTILGERASVVNTGYDTERGRYFIGYHTGSLSLVVYSTYTMKVPEQKTEDLKVHGESAAAQVIDHMLQELNQ